MYYTPAVVIPGKVAHIKIEWARTSAQRDNTYVMDENFNIIEDYRDEDDQEDEEDIFAL